MNSWSSKQVGLSYDAILQALAAKSRETGQEETVRTMRNRARFIAERALELPFEDRHSWVDRKIWGTI